MAMNPLHLYFHVPFCVSRCGYCDFATAETRGAAQIRRYVDLLLKDLALGVRAWGLEGARAETLYFGGGTPSLLAPEEIGRVLSAAHDLLDVNPRVEITLECNPGARGFRLDPDDDPVRTGGLAGDWLREARAAGANRVSIGVQATAPDLLALLDRRHDAEDAREFLNAARAAGFDNASADLMYGLPGQSLDDWMSALQTVAGWGPEHISFYCLEAHKSTPLEAAIRAGAAPAPDPDLAALQYEEAVPALERMGFAQYEISNFARPGRESRHNMAYWEGKDWLGLGVSAHSHLSGLRFWKTRPMEDYRRRLERNEIPEDGRERLSASRAAFEAMTVRLRLRRPIAPEETAALAGDRLEEILARFARWEEAGFMRKENGAWSFTTKGFLISNALLSELAPD